jgi:intracellular sulfur oxidation DsrE/DsrF family protein
VAEAEPELQKKLITTYFNLLVENNILPAAICFYTRGVHLVVQGSPVIDALKTLEARGVRVILCSTCLNYYPGQSGAGRHCRRDDRHPRSAAPGQ